MSTVDIVGLISAALMFTLATVLAVRLHIHRRHHQVRLAKLHIHGMTARVRQHHDKKSSD